MWLGAWNDEEEEDERKANDQPATPVQHEMKCIFEEAIGDWLFHHFHSSEYRLTRELFNYAYGGMRSSPDLKNMENILDEWSVLRRSHTASEKDVAKDSESFLSA